MNSNITPKIYDKTHGFFWPFFTGLLLTVVSFICCIIFNIIDKITSIKIFGKNYVRKKLKIIYFFEGIKNFQISLWITIFLGAIGYGVYLNYHSTTSLRFICALCLTPTIC